MYNLIHLKYALEIESTGSISKAAKNLYMTQPQLSRALKELEDAPKMTHDSALSVYKYFHNSEENI